MTDLVARIVAEAVDGDLWDAGRRVAWNELCDAIRERADSVERQRRFRHVIDTTRVLIAQRAT